MVIASFNEQIKILVELQKIDSEVYHLSQKLAAHPEFQKKIESEFDKKKVHLKQAEDDVKAAQMKLKEKEGDLASKEEKIKKFQAQLYQLKSNKEYSAMELEIKGLKADNSLLEEDILKLMDAVEESRGKVAKEKEALAVEEKVFKQALDVLSKEASTLNASIDEAREKRTAFVPNIEPKLLTQYERILQKREGLALVPVKQRSCGGCHLELPPQTMNEIQMQDKLMTCESCARILYWMP